MSCLFGAARAVHALVVAIMLALAAASTLILALGPAAAQTKAFARDDLASAAIRLVGELRREHPNVPAGEAAGLVGEARRLLADAPRDAMQAAGRAVAAAPEDAAAWLLLAQATYATPPNDDSDRWFLQDRALSAGYGAYLRNAGQGEADALVVVGRVLFDQSNWRGAINAWRASLALAPNAEIQSAFDQLVIEQGFRAVNYVVDSDSREPRLCVEFSEPIAKDAEVEGFVALTGGSGDNPVSAEGSKLCVGGLRHGARYGVVVRAGLPSIYEGETLREPLDYQIYVRDRAPAVRTTGRNYVLPRTGQKGLPLISVNTATIEVEIHRVNDRSLVQSLQSEEFMTALGSWTLDQLRSARGERIWKGTLEAQNRLNEDVTTAFPVMTAVPEMKAGVYVLTARPFVERAEGAYDYVDYFATQWFVVSDVGLSALRAEDGLSVFARSLADAAPLPGVALSLVARNNEVLGEAVTDETGRAVFPPGLSRGEGGLAPQVVTARTASGDLGFLDVAGPAFDFTDRGVAGRVAPTTLDGFLYTERGVYRSGEFVNVTALLRDPAGVAASAPLTLVVTRPDGVEFRRAAVEDQGLGGRAFSFQLLGNAQPGSWQVAAFVDPKAPAIGAASFLVEDYVPERLAVTLTPAAPVVRIGEPAAIGVDAQYLYGAPGANLSVGGDFIVEAAEETGIPALEGYAVGITDEAFETVYGQIDAAATTTDAEGKATVNVSLPAVSAPRPLRAQVTLNVGEPGGRAVTRQVRLPIAPAGALIGLRRIDAAPAGGASAARFGVVVVDGDGARIDAPGLEWELFRIETDYQWFNRDGRWDYEVITSRRAAGAGRVDALAASEATIAAPLDLASQYELVVAGADGAETALTFSNGWDGGGSAAAPDKLSIALDAKDYAVGAPMRVRLDPGFEGKASILIVNDRVREHRLVEVPAAGATVEIPVGADWGAGAYVLATAYRPIDVGNRRMPGRSVGLARFDIARSARDIAVAIETPASIRPRGTLEIPVALSGLAAGEEAYVTVSAVDTGILNLTRYQLPDASGHFFGQRQLAAEMRDLYGFLIDGMQGEAGAMREGGDAAALNTGAIPPTQQPLARYSGVVRVEPDGRAMVPFDIPAFNGSVKVMAVAWSRGRVGQAEREVVIRDPLVVQATLPRFLAVGDRSRFFLAIDNVEAPAGDYTFELDVDGPVVVPVDALSTTLRIDAGGRAALTIPVSAAGLGDARFDLRITGPGGVDLTQSNTLRVQPSTQTIVRRSVVTLARDGGALTVGPDLLAELLPGSGAVAASVGPIAALDVPALLASLDRYPYGCTEQTVSRALPLLYANELATGENLPIDGDIDGRIAAAIDRVLARQDSNGAFGLWAAGGDDLWLDAFVSDFLTRAREKDVAVPQRGFETALDRLRNQVANASEIQPDTAAPLAYAMYVLARNGRPVMGDLRYVADSRLDAVAAPLAKAQIGAALAMLGDRTRADRAFKAAVAALEQARDNGRSRPDYGSKLRDGVAVLTLLAENAGDRADIAKVAGIVEETRAGYALTSTQEQTWIVLAARAMAKEAANLDLEVNGRPFRGPFNGFYREATLQGGPVSIVNRGPAEAKVALSVSGVPTTPEPAVERGFKVERTLYAMDGTLASPEAIRQNDRLVVVLRVTEAQPAFARLLLVDPLPAGLEIDNPALVDAVTVASLPWLTTEVFPTTAEYRDDRFVAAFDRYEGQPATFTVAYTVRAVSPGAYVHPGAFIEDMYRPDLFGRSDFGGVTIAPAR